MQRRKLIILDTTLREGEQAPGHTMLIMDKVALAEVLERLNVDVIEAGCAAASPGDFASIQAVSRAVKTPVVSSLCRPVPADIDRSCQALKEARHPRIHIILGLSDFFLNYELNMDRTQALAAAVKAVKYAREQCPDVQFTVEDAARTELVLLARALEAVIEAGAGTVDLSDTLGHWMPEELAGLVKGLKGSVKGLSRARLSVHVHNDQGMALASTLAAVEAGVDQVECTLNGQGDRAGMCAMEELAAVLKNRQDYFSSVRTDLKGELFPEACRLAARITGTRIPYHKPIVGAGSRSRLSASALFV